jgi:hypothetical protein
MAVLHKEFITFNSEIKLSTTKKDSLKTSRKELRNKIRNWFKDNKPNEIQPKFASQGSIEMNTCINPISTENAEGKKQYKYDLDDGVYFIEKEGQDNKRAIDTWHDWVFQSVDTHTGVPSKRKTTCVRVIFADGHHIDLPIYYKKGNVIDLAHRSKDWTPSDPKEFYEWFNKTKNSQVENIVRYLKSWKNFHENKKTNLKLPSGFELTILAVNNYAKNEDEDKAFRDTVEKINLELNKPGGFKCLLPTTPKNRNTFEGYSDTRKDNFLKELNGLLKDLDKAKDESNFKTASEILINNQFGVRFPKGEDKIESQKSKELGKSIGTAKIPPKPYGK